MDCSTFAFDLHVLGTPPALILSQDQTLKFNSSPTFARLRALQRFGEASAEQLVITQDLNVALGFEHPLAHVDPKIATGPVPLIVKFYC